MKQEMEDRLRQALRRKEAPDGFAERVLAHAARQTQARRGNANERAVPPRAWWVGFISRPSWAFALTTALVIVIAAGLYWQHVRREATLEQARQDARQEVLYALRLTNEKMAPARRALAQLGIRLGDPPAERPERR